MDRVGPNLQRTVLWGALATAFRPPCATARLPEGLLDAARRLGLDARGLVQAEADEPLAARQLAFRRLFGRSPVGGCPCREASYGLAGALAGPRARPSVSAYYEGHGFPVTRAVREGPDHIANECEFLSFLALKEACAEQVHGTLRSALCRLSTAEFLGGHLARFGRAVAARVRRASDSRYYREAAELLDEMILLEADRLGVESGPEALPLRGEDAGDDGGRLPADETSAVTV